MHLQMYLLDHEVSQPVQQLLLSFPHSLPHLLAKVVCLLLGKHVAYSIITLKKRKQLTSRTTAAPHQASTDVRAKGDQQRQGYCCVLRATSGWVHSSALYLDFGRMVPLQPHRCSLARRHELSFHRPICTNTPTASLTAWTVHCNSWY